MNNTNFFVQNPNHFNKYDDIVSRHSVRSKSCETPMISIVIPTYKKFDMCRIALDSALRQKGNYSYEIVVVNDDPEDVQLEEYINTIPAQHLQYYRNEKNLGLFGNWNRCFELARGEWVALLNDDDYLYDFFLEEVMNVISQFKDIQYLYIGHDIAKIRTAEQAEKIFASKEKYAVKNRKKQKGIKEVIENGVTLSQISVLDHFMTQLYTHPVGAVLRRDNVLALGGYNEEFYPSSDWIFNVNYTMKYNMYYLNKSLGCRSEGINLSSNITTRLKFVEVDYQFRNQMAKQWRLPFTHWYTQCMLHSHAKRMGILNKIEIEQIKKRSVREIDLYYSIRQTYIKLRNILNYIKCRISKRKEGLI